MSKHEAAPTIKTLFIECIYEGKYGQNTPDRNGKHRVVESFNPASGIYTTIKDGAES